MPRRALVMLMVPPHVRDRHPAHELRHRLGASRQHHEMPVVRHQAPTQQLDVVALQALLQNRHKRGVITRLVKQSLPRISAIQDVITDIRFNLSTCTWHGPRMIPTTKAVKKGSDPFLTVSMKKWIRHFCRNDPIRAVLHEKWR